jgi:hypothetical protein
MERREQGYEESPQDLKGAFSWGKAPYKEDWYLSFSNPPVRACSCLISDFALPTFDRFAFSRKSFCSLILGERFWRLR